jgi:predicted nucleic acid-binding protein
MTLVDSNVLLDVFSESPWVVWSKQQLARAARRGPVVINDVIYAEISVQFTSFESLDAVLKKILIDVALHTPSGIIFCREGIPAISKCGGLRTGVLSDFFIDAHATIQNIPIVTRDVRRYRHYFPTVELIAP